MFTDARSKRVVLAAHCVLNQNARLDECAYFPGAMGDIARALVDSEVGILQLPCPELECLGLDRSGCAHNGQRLGIREALLGHAQAACWELVQGVMRQVREYRKHDFEIVGVIGNDGSPACGVELTYYAETTFGPGQGAFMGMLREELRRSGLDLPFIATQDNHWEEALVKVREMVGGASA